MDDEDQPIKRLHSCIRRGSTNHKAAYYGKENETETRDLSTKHSAQFRASSGKSTSQPVHSKEYAAPRKETYSADDSNSNQILDSTKDLSQLNAR